MPDSDDSSAAPPKGLKDRVISVLRAAYIRVRSLFKRAFATSTRVLSWIATRTFTPRGMMVFALKAFAVVVVASFLIGVILVYYAISRAPQFEPVSKIVYLDQGWGLSRDDPYREVYYYTPQGTSLKGLRYNWFVNLERPRDRVRFASPDHMRAYGFLVDVAPTRKNPDQMPVGFARHWDPELQDQVVDITCAACHTGQINIMQNGEPVGIRIDGGPAMHAFTAVRIGNFVPELIGSMLITYLDPPTFYRFARNVLGPTFPSGWLKLHGDLRQVLWAFIKQGWTERTKHLYPVEEGFGRTDAIGRIANTVFGDHISEENYRVGNAPVSYPPVWDIYKFDWVQYGASVRHPLARNVGEGMGVGSTYRLVDGYGRPVPAEDRFGASTMIHELTQIEAGLQRLKPPPWPEDLLGPIDCKRAMLGKYLFNEHCWGCHGPHPADEKQTMIDAPGKLKRSPRLQAIAEAFGFNHLSKPPFEHWRMTTVAIDDIGTDPNAALNFVNHRIDLSATGMTAADLQNLLRPLLEERLARKLSGTAPADRKGLEESGRADITRQLDGINIKSVSTGEGLNYFGILIRQQFRKDPRYAALETGLPKPDATEGPDDDIFFGQIDLPATPLAYKARPLAGAWATAPYLHNGSVPNLYEMLLPADRRTRKFFVGRRLFDPVHLGYALDPLLKGGFWLDTSIAGNHNTGHEFRAGYVNIYGDTAPPPPAEVYAGSRVCAESAPPEPNELPKGQPNPPPQYGVIGPELTDQERWAILEYLKIRQDPPGPHEFPGHCFCGAKAAKP